MTETSTGARSRRSLLKTGGVLAGTLFIPDLAAASFRMANPAPAPKTPEAYLPPKPFAQPITSPRVVRPDLMRRAMASLDAHSSHGIKRDRFAIADFAAPSNERRFHIVDLANGRSTSFLVAHGSGSDPAHTGWLQRFSNPFGSNASSEGAFRTDDYYYGQHGRSQRLVGLDSTNNNALDRAIVVHAAWYANPDMIAQHGMLGRSQGCFAVGDDDLSRVFDRLGPNRMIFAAKV